LRARHVIVVGAGMGGLAAAADLGRQGYAVTVLERAANPGGKMREVQVGGQPIDGGPTVFTMAWVFQGLFADAGEHFEEHLTLQSAQILARHRWDGGGDLDLFADIDQSADAIAAFAGQREGDGYKAFCKASQDMYETLRGPFIEAQKPNLLNLPFRIGLHRLDALWRTAPHKTMWQGLSQYFKDPRLLQLFGRYATYCGSSPFLAPATLMLVAHVEQDGVWRVPGGMARVAQALQGLGERQGVQFCFNAHVEAINTSPEGVTGVRLASGEMLSCDAIVFNGDMSALGKGLLGPAVSQATTPVAPPQRSQSALTWCVRARTRGMEMAHHNVFFSRDYKAEFDAVFKARTCPAEPTIYVCAQDRDDTCTASQEHERLLILINAPADGDAHAMSEDELQRAKDSAWALMARCGLQVDTVEEVATAPNGFNALFPASGGALYGRANHGMLGSFQRPGARSPIKGLYLAGGSVHPGPGIPMATLSGRLAAAALVKDMAR
jgi:1-hydroxycarotenoid 3,4-desaturase